MLSEGSTGVVGDSVRKACGPAFWVRSVSILLSSSSIRCGSQGRSEEVFRALSRSWTNFVAARIVCWAWMKNDQPCDQEMSVNIPDV
jgi:hypothetical protein